MEEFSGINGIKKDSWICCVKISGEETALNDFLKKLVRHDTRYTNRITEKYDNLYSIVTNTKHNIIDLDNLTRNNEDKYYSIVFSIDKNDMINPLYLMPYPCKRKDGNECDYIKALG